MGQREIGLVSRLSGERGDAESAAGRPEVRAAAVKVTRAAMGRVQEPSRGVKVEDYVTVLASLAGEAALAAAELFDIEATKMPPGAAVFGDKINMVLTGDNADAASAPADSVVGVLMAELVPATAPAELFWPPDDYYRSVAANVKKAAWGNVTTSVPDANKPRVVPLQVAFELRDAVDAAQSEAGLPRSLRHVVCALALADGLKQVQHACDMGIAVRLAMEIVFGMAKMVPMSRAAFEAVRSDSKDQS